MSKPEKFSFMELERDIKRTIVELWDGAKAKQYDRKRWGKLQSDFDYYASHTKQILKEKPKP